MYVKIQEVFNNKTWHEYNLKDSSTYPTEKDSLVVLIKATKTINGEEVIADYIFKLNENHPDIK